MYGLAGVLAFRLAGRLFSRHDYRSRKELSAKIGQLEMKGIYIHYYLYDS